MSDRRIHKAARRADLDALRRELAKGVSPNASGQYGRTPLQKVIAAGGFGRYERNHLDALAATFAPHFSHLPPEIVRLVVEYAFHAGYY